jgi:hypothetical protein
MQKEESVKVASGEKDQVPTDPQVASKPCGSKIRYLCEQVALNAAWMLTKMKSCAAVTKITRSGYTTSGIKGAISTQLSKQIHSWINRGCKDFAVCHAILKASRMLYGTLGS